MAFHNVPPNGFPDLPDMEELEAVVKDLANVKTSVAGLATDVSNLNDNKANQITIAPFFSAETAYEVGDLVYYNGLTYRCTNDHDGEWDADDFAATTISNELDTLKSGLTNLASEIITPSQIAYHLGHVAINHEHDVQKTVTLAQGESLSNYDFIIVGNSYYDSGAATYGFAVVPTSVMLSIYNFDAGLTYWCAISKTPVHVVYDATNNAFKFNAESTVPNGNYFFVGGVKLRTRS